LFRDFLALHFSASRPPSDEWRYHPVIVTVVEELGHARDRGEIPADVDIVHNGVTFLVGLYALLMSIPAAPKARRPFIDEYVTTYMYGLRALRPG
jgi:hypothetical protein